MRQLFFILFILSSHFSIGQQFSNQENNLNLIGSFGAGSFIGGGAVSFVDFTGDGLDDLSFGTIGGQEIKFYENTGDGFSLVTPAYISNTYEQRQILWVDYDNDGDKDLYVTALDGPNLLYENDGNMNFTDVSAAKGLSDQVVFTIGATFADINNDGFLDLYVCNYDEDGIANTGFENEMYSYNSQTQSYDDITLSSGTSNGSRTSFTGTFFDLDMDNDLDLYVINDFTAHENSLYMNIGNSQFVDISVPSQSNVAIFSMNGGISDYDRDGDFDIFITDIFESVLLQNDGDNTFTEVAASAGVQIEEWSWTGNFFDFDNDRDDDLYVSTQVDDFPNYFFVNDNNGSFTKPLHNTGGIGGNDIVESCINAIGDINNDGRLDIAISERDNENFRLYINNEENSNNFIKLDLQGVSSNSDGYGALVQLWADSEMTMMHKHNSISLQCQNSDILHFGLGVANTIDSIVVKWPYNNSIDVLYNSDVLINGLTVVEEGSGAIDHKSLELCLVEHQVVLDPVPSQIYGAINELSSNTEIICNGIIKYQAENLITLDAGFEVKSGSSFEAEIEVCGN